MTRGEEYQRDTEVPQPALAWVGLTNRCNLKCAHCQREVLRARGLLKLQDMPVELFDKLEEQLFPNLERVQFGGNNFGEPLLTANWDRFFDRLRRFDMQVSVVSNARLLTPARVRTMVERGVEFNLSLEGGTAETYRRFRGHSLTDFVGIVGMACEEVRRRNGTHARVNLGFTARRDNIEELGAVISLAARLGVSRVTVTHFVPWHESQRQQSLVYHKEVCNRTLEKAAQQAREAGIVIDIPEPFEVGDQQARHRQLEAVQHFVQRPCRLPWTSVSINERGDVMPCCASSVVLGNLEQADFGSIWNGSRYRKLRRTVNTRAAPRFCRNCALRGIDVGSEKPLAFCSDERLLLAAIGPSPGGKGLSRLRKMKGRLGATRFGRRLVPVLTEFYRRRVPL